ncbi:MAG: LysR family transcriptional regulator [Bacteroidales bacterium]
MAGNIGSKYYDIFLDYRIWLTKTDKGEVLNHYHFVLLEAINRKQSILLAAEELVISYRKAWGMVKEMEEHLGFPLVNSQRGGKEGSSTSLSEDGLRLLNAYITLKDEMDAMFKENVRKFFHSINV